MTGSGILENVIQYKKTNKKSATHFALCNGSKVRYLISLTGGKKRLSTNLSPYSNKLEFLMNIMNYLPFRLLQIGKLGYFVESKFGSEAFDYITGTSKPDSDWNVIVGTYDDKQKLVVQLWESEKSFAIYYKVGNKGSSQEMNSEIEFLKTATEYKSFSVPGFIGARTMDNRHKFNIQISREFTGEKVEPVLTDAIYKIFKELVESRGVEVIDGSPYGFSHGDFAPWNMKKNKNGYVLFDWEHCGIRFYGFDLIHYVFQIENLLNKKSREEAIKMAVGQAKKFDNVLGEISTDKLQQLYFKECVITYGG